MDGSGAGGSTRAAGRNIRRSGSLTVTARKDRQDYSRLVGHTSTASHAGAGPTPLRSSPSSPAVGTLPPAATTLERKFPLPMPYFFEDEIHRTRSSLTRLHRRHACTLNGPPMRFADLASDGHSGRTGRKNAAVDRCFAGSVGGFLQTPGFAHSRNRPPAGFPALSMVLERYESVCPVRVPPSPICRAPPPTRQVVRGVRWGAARRRGHASGAFRGTTDQSTHCLERLTDNKYCGILKSRDQDRSRQISPRVFRTIAAQDSFACRRSSHARANGAPPGPAGPERGVCGTLPGARVVADADRS